MEKKMIQKKLKRIFSKTLLMFVILFIISGCSVGINSEDNSISIKSSKDENRLDSKLLKNLYFNDTKTTLDYANIRGDETNFINVILQGVEGIEDNGYAEIGIDLLFEDGYNPGHNSKDPYYGANCMAKDNSISYYKAYYCYKDGSNSFPYGIFIDNFNVNTLYKYTNDLDLSKYDGWHYVSFPIDERFRNLETLNHNWAKKTKKVCLEIYSKKQGGACSNIYGGARIEVDNFNYYANGGYYSPFIGKVILPTSLNNYGNGNYSQLNGLIWENGKQIQESRLCLSYFQTGALTSTTSNGFPVAAFASRGDDGHGYYSSGPLYPGVYKIYVEDTKNKKSKIIYADIYRSYERIDFNLDTFFNN